MRRAAPIFVLGLAALARTAAGLWLGFRPFDDTYITLRYARNLAAGHGFVYNVDEHVLGTTTPLWALVLATAGSIGVALETAAFVVPLALDVATALLIFRMLRRLDYANVVAVSAAVLFLCLFDYFSLARSGMETSAFVLLIVFALERIAHRGFAAASFLTGAACIMRPEGVVLIGVLAIAMWLRRPVRWVTPLIVFAAVTLTWVGYAWYVFGSFVPQTIIAKASSNRDLTQLSWQHLLLFIAKGQYGQYGLYTRTYVQAMPVMSVLVGIAVVGLLMRRSLEQLSLLTLFPAGFTLGLAMSGAFTYFTWYYGPIYPFYAILAVIGLSRFGNTVVVLGTFALCTANLIAGVMIKLPNDGFDHVGNYREVVRRIPADASVTVATAEIGAVGWAVWPARIVDLEGLVTPAAVGVHHADYVRKTQPDYLVLPGDNNADEFLSRGEKADWFTRTYRVITVVPHGTREYRTYQKKTGGP